ncbi:hypothetical protein VE00_05971 [Pseudogymnoascus sp. WSF 3629]|nr:hypothetical protein VE00_05971 [Pseudogymnoascus sp. WSF 3629]
MVQGSGASNKTFLPKANAVLLAHSMLTLIIFIVQPLNSTVLKIMKTTSKPDSDINDEPEGEHVPKAFIAGCSEGPIPLMEWTSKEIVLMETEDFPVQSPVHVIVASVKPPDPDSVDIPGIDVPDTEDIPVEPGGNDISGINVPNTENAPVEPGSIDISEADVPDPENIPVKPPDSIDISGVILPNTENIPVEPDSIDIPGANVPNVDNIPVEPDSIDISGVKIPNTVNIPVELESIEISGVNIPNTDDIPVEPETSILQPLSSTAIDVPVEPGTSILQPLSSIDIPIDPETSILQPLSSTAVEVLAGSQVPTINIILNSAGIMSIREHTHSRGRIEMYFSTNHTGYFLFACLIAPQLIEPVYDIPNEQMIVKTDRS